MVHKKSLKAQQKRKLKLEQTLRARRLLSDMNFHDHELAEVVHTIEEKQLIEVLYRCYGFIDPKAVNLVCAGVNRFMRGMVRVDSLGRGSVQQLREHEKPVACRFTPER